MSGEVNLKRLRNDLKTVGVGAGALDEVDLRALRRIVHDAISLLASPQVWWCERGTVPGEGHAFDAPNRYCYWTGTVDHNEGCGWAVAIRVEEWGG